MNNINEHKPVQIIRLQKLIETCGLSRSTIYSMLDPKSKRYDPHFPKQLRLGISAVGWLKHEIDAWLLAKRHH